MAVAVSLSLSLSFGSGSSLVAGRLGTVGSLC
jgi:hypothetical protein